MSADIPTVNRTMPTDQAVADAYVKSGSVWLAAAALGVSGQYVNNVVRRLGIPSFRRRFTAEDSARLVAEYEHHAKAGTLAILAKSMGRTRQFLARKAKDAALTRRDRPRPYSSETCSINAKAQIAKNGHPRGFHGKSHTEEARAVQGTASKAMWAGLTPEERASLTDRQMQAKIEAGISIAPERPQASWKAGWREVGEQRCYFRSAWEANYARYLEMLRLCGEIQEWRHEPEVFWFEAIRQGVRSYKPDFRVVEKDGDIRFHEVKGWMDTRSRTCLQRMGKFYPSTIIILIDAKAYADIERKVRRFIPAWEEKPKPARSPRRLRMAVPVQPLQVPA